MEALSTFPAERREALLGALWFEEAYVPASAIPELSAHLRANAAEYATALAAEDSGVVVYVNVHAGRFIEQLGSSLAAGFIVTIDYGDTTWGLIQGARRGEFPFRVYGDWQKDYVPRPNDPYSAPGTQDMTSDVNFTDLARAGRQAGLEVLHYGPERDVTGDELPELLRAARAGAVAEFLGNPVFKVLVLGTRASDVFTGPLMTPLPLSAGEKTSRSRGGGRSRTSRRTSPHSRFAWPAFTQHGRLSEPRSGSLWRCCGSGRAGRGPARRGAQSGSHPSPRP